MLNIEPGRPIEFIRHRRESGGYEKRTEVTDYGRTYTTIERVDNRTELDQDNPRKEIYENNYIQEQRIQTTF